MTKPAPVILNGVPGNNSISLPLGGTSLLWGGLQLTNYTLSMYGGPGSVNIIGPSSLVNSGFIMTAQENLNVGGPMKLDNSQLSVGGSLNGTSPITATNHSTVTALSSDSTVTVNLQSSALTIQNGGSFIAPVVLDAASTVNIEGTFSVGANNWGVYSTGNQLGTLNLVDGPVSVSGVMQVNANMVQSAGYDPYARVDIFNGGRLMLAGSSSGGEIDITAGTLEFSQSPGFMHGPETASENFSSKLAFNGSSGAVQFEGVGQLMIGIMPKMNEIAVFSHRQEIADFHLAPSSSPYSAREFSVHGNTLFFHHI